MEDYQNINQSPNITSDPALVIPPVPPKPKLKLPIFLVVIIGLFLIAGSVSAAFLFVSKAKPKNQVMKSVAKIPTPTSGLSVAMPHADLTSTPFSVTGTIKELPNDLSLIISLNPVYYYDAGTYTSGPYAGYERILATDTDAPGGGAGPYCSGRFFLTKDNLTYIGVLPSYDSDQTSSSVTSTITMDSLAKDIKLSDGSQLIGSQLNLQSSNLGNNKYSCKLQYDMSHNTQLSSDNSYHFYTTDPQGSLVTTSTQIIVTDPSGLPFSYTLSKIVPIDTNGFDDYHAKQQYDLFGLNPSALNYSSVPNTTSFYARLQAISFGTNPPPTDTNINGFNYSPGLSINYPDNPQFTPDFTHLTQDNFVQITSIGNQVPLYGLNNNPITHSIYQTRFGKIAGIFQQHKSFLQTNNGSFQYPTVTQPTFNEYVAKNPFLFVKDPWGRYVLFEENAYYTFHEPGGGKPVIYLYPTQKTQVHISFGKRMDLSVQIPFYHNGWNVEAFPNGTITDLQPQFTKCDSINTKVFGSEYAGDACRKNQYPYIYWAGYIHNESFPIISDGWTVTDNGLQTFLQEKLTELGLTTNEQQDMMSYWIPKMREQNVPYYHIGFLTTSDMNTLVPMTVTPKPDTIIRIFLDWTPLSQRPAMEPSPQKLSSPKRNGFTYVEWGGLKW